MMSLISGQPNNGELIMPDKVDLTAEQLRELLRYEPETGEFFWVKSRGTMKAGKKAGRERDGYIGIQINGRKYAAHRLAILYVTGLNPMNVVDHINFVTTDNRISNLRLATKSQNNCHRGKQKSNASGYKGVSWDTGVGKWYSRVTYQKKVYCLGYFNNPEDAHKAYVEKAKVLHGQFFHPG